MSVISENDFGAYYPTNGRTIERWNLEFRTHGYFLRHLHPSKRNMLPPLLLDNLDVCKNIKVWCRSNLDGLTVERVHEYVHDKILPDLALQKRATIHIDDGDISDETSGQDDDDDITSASVSDLLKFYGLKSLSVVTIYRWMRTLGLKYKMRTKNFYVDGHECEDNIRYRLKYVNRYFRDEFRMFRWL